MTPEQYLRDYLFFKASGDDLSDTRFAIGPDHIRIYQPIDDEEEDKYDINRADVPANLWTEFVKVFG